jgi:hypothetical protein
MSFRVGGRTRLASGATALRPKCLIVAISISLASFLSPVAASASPTGQVIEEVVISAGSTVTAATSAPPSLPPTAVPSVPTPTPPAKIPIPIPSRQGSVTIPRPPASYVPNPSNSVGSVRSEIVQVGDGSGNVANGVGKETLRPSLSFTPVGHDPLAEREHPPRTPRQVGERVSTKRGAKAVPPRWIARVWPAVALWGTNQRTQPGGGNASPSADLFEIPRALLRSMGLVSPANAPRVGSVPSVRSETPDGSLLPPTTVAPSSDWAVILFGTMGLLFLVTITPWSRGTR